MARNSEKAQSMLFRFREAQAAELGLATRMTRRPKMVTLVTNIRDCERFRGEILKEISRKVDKIQDPGLTDYEIRDLNDEINGLLREKSNFERQIVSLGGANYRRSTAMVDESGREIPGTRGYKYFGRAKELPGVKELFERTDGDENLEDEVYQPFMDKGPEYYGDFNEIDNNLLDYESQLEIKAYQNSLERVKVVLNTGEVEDESQSITKPQPLQDIIKSMQSNDNKFQSQSLHSDFLIDSDLQPPQFPSKEETDKALLNIRKQALLNDYGV